MSSALRNRITYANVASTLALFAALSGGAWAVTSDHAGRVSRLTGVRTTRGNVRFVSPNGQFEFDLNDNGAFMSENRGQQYRVEVRPTGLTLSEFAPGKTARMKLENGVVELASGQQLIDIHTGGPLDMRSSKLVNVASGNVPDLPSQPLGSMRLNVEHELATNAQDSTTTLAHNSTSSVGGDATSTVQGNSTDSVGKNRSTNIAGSATSNFGLNDTESVGNDETTNVAGNASSTVGGDASSSFQGNDTEQVAKNQNLTVNGTQSTKGKSITTTSSGGMIVEAGGEMTDTAGTDITTTAGEAITTTAGTDSTTTAGADITNTAGKALTNDATTNLTNKVNGDLLNQAGVTLTNKSGGALVDRATGTASLLGQLTHLGCASPSHGVARLTDPINGTTLSGTPPLPLNGQISGASTTVSAC